MQETVIHYRREQGLVTLLRSETERLRRVLPHLLWIIFQIWTIVKEKKSKVKDARL